MGILAATLRGCDGAQNIFRFLLKASVERDLHNLTFERSRGADTHR